MRINEYTSLEQFYNEFDDQHTIKDCEKSIGIEFIYNKTYYRMCKEPIPLTERPVLSNGKTGNYDVLIVHWKNDLFGDFEYELIGWYSDLDDVLENCILQQRK
ncbi:MAG: hypothetical protein MJ050_07710 [Phascolarctobacterium sp.]|nr:hypothetical protein [Phascolarctobacterium sp.]